MGPHKYMTSEESDAITFKEQSMIGKAFENIENYLFHNSLKSLFNEDLLDSFQCIENRNGTGMIFQFKNE